MSHCPWVFIHYLCIYISWGQRAFLSFYGYPIMSLLNFVAQMVTSLVPNPNLLTHCPRLFQLDLILVLSLRPLQKMFDSPYPQGGSRSPLLHPWLSHCHLFLWPLWRWLFLSGWHNSLLVSCLRGLILYFYK